MNEIQQFLGADRSAALEKQAAERGIKNLWDQAAKAGAAAYPNNTEAAAALGAIRALQLAGSVPTAADQKDLQVAVAKTPAAPVNVVDEIKAEAAAETETTPAKS
jgi:hypothetical protein